MLGWIVLGVILAIVTAAITLIWWWVGDQWADDEYKKFGHGGGARPVSEHTRVIRDAQDPEPVIVEGTTDDEQG